jgi:uncharacterized protein YjiS (DUF1127 family)
MLQRITPGRSESRAAGPTQEKREKIMSTTTVTNVGSQNFEVGSGSAKGYLRRIADALMQSREQAARRRVALHLSAMNDERLAAFGFSAADIESIRAGEPVANILGRRARAFD